VSGDGRYRYYLTEEREVTKAEFVSAERRAGFINTLGQRDEPATASFSGRTGDAEIRGRTVYAPPEPTPDHDLILHAHPDPGDDEPHVHLHTGPGHGGIEHTHPHRHAEGGQ
jgi:hypothetical protein